METHNENIINENKYRNLPPITDLAHLSYN